MAKTPQFEKAKQFALDWIKDETPRLMWYHNLEHTKDSVLPAAERLLTMEGVKGKETQIVMVAAAYHDIGYTMTYQDHEEASAYMAGDMLPQFGYSKKDIRDIKKVIMATRLPQTPENILEKIMCDADIDILGTDDFFTKNGYLMLEMNNNGSNFETNEWNKQQLEFLEQHNYFTASARELNNEGKQKNIALMRTLSNSLGLNYKTAVQ